MIRTRGIHFGALLLLCPTLALAQERASGPGRVEACCSCAKRFRAGAGRFAAG